jgi:hypothetical protein
MTTVDDAALALWLAGALDPDDALEVTEWLEASPEARRRLPALRFEAEAPPVGAWRIPPPALGCRVGLVAPAVMGDGDVRAGERFALWLDPVSPADDFDVVVLRREADGWQVLAPGSAEERFPLSAFPREPDGRHRIDLLARGPAGPQRWAIALMSSRAPIDWSRPPETRWATLQQDIARGVAPVASFAVDVED